MPLTWNTSLPLSVPETDTACCAAAHSASEDHMLTTEEDVLLEEALSLIGDLDFLVDDSTIVTDDLSRLLWDEVPEAELSETVAVSNMSSLHVDDPAVQEILRGLAQPTPIRPAPMKFTELPAPAPNPAPVVNKARIRRREELIYLRGLVGDLEQRLTKLRSNPRPTSPKLSKEVTVETGELLSAWEKIVARQIKQREAAEMENIKLRRLLEDQIQVGKSFERLLLKKRPTLEAVEVDAGLSKRLRRTNSRSWNRALIFDELLKDCDAQYTQTARVLTQFKHISILSNHREVGLVHDPILGLTLQTKELRVLPFEYMTTADEIWGFFPTASTVHRMHEYHDVDITDDTLKFQFRVIGEAAGSRGDLSVKMTTRRYIEADRTVVIMCGIMEPSAISDENMDGVRVRLTAWHVIEPIFPAGSSTSSATKVIGHLVAVPEIDEDQPAQKVGTLTDFLLAAIAVEIDSRSQHLEDRLLQRSMNHPHVVWAA